MTHKKPSAVQLRALRAFIRHHGSSWKRVLRAQWMSASATPTLMRLRNQFGPSWLAGFKMPRASSKPVRSVKRAVSRKRRSPARRRVRA